MRLPDSSPVLDKNRAPMGPEILSSTGAGVWRKASMAFPDSSSVPDKFQSAILPRDINLSLLAHWDGWYQHVRDLGLQILGATREPP